MGSAGEAILGLGGICRWFHMGSHSVSCLMGSTEGQGLHWNI